MYEIKYRLDLDFMASLIHHFSPSDIEADSPMLEDYSDSRSLWKEHEDQLSFSNRNLIGSIGIASAFMDFLNYCVYLNSIEWLINLTPESFLHMLKIKHRCEELTDEEAIYSQVNVTLEDYYRSTPADFTIFKECIFRPLGIIESIRVSFEEAFSVFQTSIYEPNLPKIEAQLSDINAKLKSEGRDYLKKIIIAGYERFEANLDTLEIYLIFAAPYWYGASFEPDYMSISHSMTLRFESNQPSEKIVDFIKLISDPKRYEMLKMLSHKPSYGAELAKALDLSTATVSHHLSKMTLLKLIDAEKAEKNRIYFKLNTKNFEEYLEMIKMDMLK